MINTSIPAIENPREERIFKITRYALGSFLVLSGIGMLFDSDRATKAVEYAYMNYREMLPGDAHFQMVVLAVVEILAGLLFITENFLYGAVFGAAIVIFAFTIPLGEVVVKGLDVPTCGCSGIFDFNLSPGWLVARNGMIYLTIWWITYMIQHGRVSYSKGKPRKSTGLEILVQKAKNQK
jgi:hypothetical protein